MQLTYSQDMPKGYPGMIADSAVVQDVESKINAAGEVKFGCVVSKGASTELIKHPAAATDITDEKLVRGIVVATKEVENRLASTGIPGYPAKSVVPVMRKGRIWVTSEDAVTEGTSPVHVRYAGTGQAGAFRASSVTNETAVLPKSKWKTSCGAGELAILEIDL